MSFADGNNSSSLVMTFLWLAFRPKSKTYWVLVLPHKLTFESSGKYFFNIRINFIDDIDFCEISVWWRHRTPARNGPCHPILAFLYLWPRLPKDEYLCLVYFETRIQLCPIICLFICSSMYSWCIRPRASIHDDCSHDIWIIDISVMLSAMIDRHLQSFAPGIQEDWQR